MILDSVNIGQPQAPVIGSIDDVLILVGTATDEIGFTVTDPTGDPVTVTATSDDQTLIADADIEVGGEREQDNRGGIRMFRAT